jgi:hypothetical protein
MPLYYVLKFKYLSSAGKIYKFMHTWPGQTTLSPPPPNSEIEPRRIIWFSKRSVNASETSEKMQQILENTVRTLKISKRQIHTWLSACYVIKLTCIRCPMLENIIQVIRVKGIKQGKYCGLRTYQKSQYKQSRAHFITFYGYECFHALHSMSVIWIQC